MVVEALLVMIGTISKGTRTTVGAVEGDGVRVTGVYVSSSPVHCIIQSLDVFVAGSGSANFGELIESARALLLFFVSADIGGDF